ncbi:MAG: NUDIX domain-containing protein [Anaerolineae bacterium]|jgi:predicted GIY-YIG superfamily endonuclease/ADP-ribose pyrophosphatase YjhB (NUDIX family)
MGKPWFLYLLHCADGTLYTGVTTDLTRRVREHNAGRGARYTAGRRPVWPVGAWRFPDRSAAQQAEARLRRLSPAEKERLALAEQPFEGGPFCGPVSDRFCPHCGAPLAVDLPPEHTRPQQVCPICRRVHYRNAKPCAGVLATREGELLLVKRRVSPFRGHWDIPGGFLEPAEHPELGAVREVREETGLEVALTAFFGFYVDQYVYQERAVVTLNTYFLGQVVGGHAQARDDAVEVGWFSPQALPSRMAFAHVRQVLADWTERVTGP